VQLGGVTKPTCSKIQSALVPINNALGRASRDLNTLSDPVNRAFAIFNPIFDISMSANWQGVKNVLTAVSPVLDTIKNILERRLSVSLPSICFDNTQVCTNIQVPNGIKMCRKWFASYPCGMNFKTIRSCVTVPKPRTCHLHLSLSVAEFFNGLLASSNPLFKAMESAVGELFKAISLPKLDFPYPHFPLEQKIDSLVNDLANFGITRADALLNQMTSLVPQSVIPECTNPALIPFDTLKVGLVAFYKLDGSLSDSSGQGRDGLAFSNPISTKGRDGSSNGAYKFVGASAQYVSLPNIASLGNTARSIFLWVQLLADCPVSGVTFLSTGTSSSRASFSLVLAPLSRLGVVGFGNDVLPTTGVNLRDGWWHHIGVVFDGVSARTYVDGLLDNVWETSFQTLGDNNFLGKSNDPSNPGYLTGSIDDVTVFNRALTEEEVRNVKVQFSRTTEVEEVVDETR
jgi:hypothetical protein